MSYLLVLEEDDGYTYASSNVYEFDDNDYETLEKTLDYEIKTNSNIYEYSIYKAELINYKEIKNEIL